MVGLDADESEIRVAAYTSQEYPDAESSLHTRDKSFWTKRG